MSKNIADMVNDMLRQHAREQAWIGVVDSVSGNKIKVRRNGQAGADAQFYAAAAGLAAAVAPGDTVLVQAAGGGYVVTAKTVV